MTGKFTSAVHDFCRELGFTLDLTAPSHKEALAALHHRLRGASWVAASGYTTRTGKNRWRVMRKRPQHERGPYGTYEQLTRSNGQVCLFPTLEAAQRRADRMNRGL